MKIHYLPLALLLVLFLAACNQAGSGTTEGVQELPTLAPTAVPIQEIKVDPTAETEPTAVAAEVTAVEAEVTDTATVESNATPVDESGGEQIVDEETAVNLDDFLLYDEPPDTNYLTTLEFYMTVTNDDGSTSQIGRVFAEGAHTVAPDASSMVFNMEGSAGGGLGETMTFVQIEDAFYYSMPPNDCISMAGQSGFENPFDLFLDTGGFLTGEVQRVLPNQTINGVDSRHYIITPENIASLAVYEVDQADLFVAEDGRYVTRLLIVGYGVNDVLGSGQMQEGEIYYELNFTPSDNVSAIALPSGCTQATEAEYPTLPDATSTLSMEGMYSYETQTPLAEAVAFYKTELQNSGWTLGQELVQAPNATLMFTGSDGTLMITMGPGQSGGTQIGIIAMP
jgi:hypothetical protein